jgi:hypothetical protein
MLSLIPAPTLSSSRRVQQRQRYRSHDTVNIANQTITAINQLATSFQQPVPSPFNLQRTSIAPLPSATSQRIQQRIYAAADRYRRHLQSSSVDISLPQNSHRSDSHHEHFHRMASSFDHLTHNSSDISYATPPPAMFIKAAAVSLPLASGTADLLSILPPHLVGTYSDPSLPSPIGGSQTG